MQAKKSLGQHFLRSKDTAQRIADAGNVREGDTVLEIGPGTGILTERLLETGAVVHAIEKDEELAGDLSIAFGGAIRAEKLHIHTADVLDTDLRALGLPAAPRGTAQAGLPCGEYIVVANIPYYITGKLLRTLLTSPCKPKRMVLLVQDEVARRAVAANEPESLLSISIAAYGTAEYVKKVPAGAFMPPPKVDSAVLRIDDIHTPFDGAQGKEQAFFDLVHVGFDQKRKQLGKKLKNTYGEHAEEALKTCGITETARAEELGISDWRCLARELT